MVDSSEMASSPTPPSVGTLIDNGALELVEVLGYGGYGVVYRAIDTYSSSPTSYAVKCLPHSQKRNASRQRQLHLREITLHQLASAHPNVVTLHRVVEDYHYTYIVMDYCSDGDLFTQILHQRRYLGHNELIKEVFLQLLDAVEYCHSLSIYHRDLKPENILCFDGGLRLAITDFGLATTDKMSTEFRTGSIYHMSPECQGGLFAYTKAYSPLFNDVWSLGIILLNLITGRNPWKSASADDVTFQAYLKDPLHFLPTVLPISEEVNRLLVRVLEVDWRRRMTLREMRIAFKGINSFYAPDVLFEDSMARCPWEAGVTAGSDSSSEPEAEAEPQDLPEDDEFASAWSNDSDSEMIFANQTATEKLSWVDDASREARHPCEYNRSMSPSPGNVFTNTRLFEQLQSCGSSPRSSYSVLSSSPSIPSLPRTPNGVGAWSPAGEVRRPKLPMLDTNGCHTQYYNESVTMLSARSSSMHTALETHIEDYGIYSAAFFDDKSRPYAGDREDVGMITTPLTANEESMPIQLAISCYPTIHADESLRSACPESPVLGLNPLGLDLNFPTQRHEAGSHESYNWEQVCMPPPSTATTAAFSFLTFDTTLPSPQTESAWHSLCFAAPPPPTPDPQHERAHAPSPLPFPFRDYPPSPTPPPLPLRPGPARAERKARTSSFLNPIRLAFPRRSSSPLRTRTRTVQTEPEPASESEALAMRWAFAPSTPTSPQPQAYRCIPPAGKSVAKFSATQEARRRRRRLLSARDWFSPGRLFAAVLPS